MELLSPFKYEGGMPPEYRCDRCGATKVRLYRNYQTFLDHQRLLCTACAECAGDTPRKVDLARPDQIGWMAAAVPTEDGSTFWGFASVPDAGVKWWRALPVST